MKGTFFFHTETVKGSDEVGAAIVNALIFAITAILVIRFSRKDGAWCPPKARYAFRFFTVQSNVLCAVSALCMVFFPDSGWAWTLKYIGTAAVTVTMLTVFFFLAPTMGGLKPLLQGNDFFMHLTTPLMAIVSFCIFEKRGMTFSAALLGMLPLVLYGGWYLYKILYAPADRRWEDFYGFNRGGKWPIAFSAMVVGGFAVCMMLMGLQNL